MAEFTALVEQFGVHAKEVLNGPGEEEAALARPVADLLQAYGGNFLNRSVVLHEEVREDSGAVRPDYGVRVDGLMAGHIELKKPDTSLDPSTYSKTSHNARQWQRLKHLPNLLHTNGVEWRLWRYGELVTDPVRLHTASLAEHPGVLNAPASFETLLTGFLSWGPTPINTVNRLVDTIAPLAALLREEVLESLQAERRSAKARGDSPTLLPFVGLRQDWRRSLYPSATDEEFADGFAQTVVFSLVIGLSEGMDFTEIQIADVAKKLEAQHSLLGRALDLLTEHVGDSTVGMVIETILRALSATNWERVSQGKQDVYLHLYEHFLSGYDPALRRQSGSYYTPIEVVRGMTRLTQQVLQKYLDTPEGLSSDSVAVIDPAMGTGTYPLAVLREVAEEASKYGAGAVADSVASAARRMYGIEIQSGPFSVAELRLSQAIREMGADIPEQGLNLYVADTLEDPKSGTSQQLSYTLQLIAQQRQQANRMKLETPIQVCIGNPPYKDKAQDMGGWVENGDEHTNSALLDDFRLDGNGRYEYVLKNLYVYFWRWAMWKVFESIPNSSDGVVCFITATGYLRGPGFKGMREWIRRNTSHGWIINLTPEGKQPPADTAVFNIETPVAIALFIRDVANDPQQPSKIRYTELHGKREEKFQELAALDLDDDSFEVVREGWTDIFAPESSKAWRKYPALNDIFPWTAPGIKPNKTWVYAPSPDLLEARWFDLIEETDVTVKRQKFKETRDTSLQKLRPPLAGQDTEDDTRTPFEQVSWPQLPSIVRVGYRSFDRQYIIADARLLHMPSPTLWAGRVASQIFLVEQHAHFPKVGPGMMVTNLIPDMHHFNNRGGRVLPILQPDGSPNTAPGLLEVLAEHFDRPITVEELAAYVVGISAHPGYVETFDEELRYEANRVPLTADGQLWQKAVDIGTQIIWLHTYGERGTPPSGITSILDAMPGMTMPQYDSPVGASMPEKVTYDRASRTLHLGKGVWSNVDERVWEYTVGGVNIIDSWVGYRRKKPKGRKSSPLDNITMTSWPTQWSKEFHELLSVLTHLIQYEDKQADLLAAVIEGPMLSYTQLATQGVTWPTEPKDRKPTYPLPEDTVIF